MAPGSGVGRDGYEATLAAGGRPAVPSDGMNVGSGDLQGPQHMGPPCTCLFSEAPLFLSPLSLSSASTFWQVLRTEGSLAHSDLLGQLRGVRASSLLADCSVSLNEGHLGPRHLARPGGGTFPHPQEGKKGLSPLPQADGTPFKQILPLQRILEHSALALRLAQVARRGLSRVGSHLLKTGARWAP